MPYKNPEKEKGRQERRRKTPEYKEYQRKYQKSWRTKNPEKYKEIMKKSEGRPERKEYLSNWWKTSPKAKMIKEKHNKSDKKKEYDKNYALKNPEKMKLKYKRYSMSIKGIVNNLKKKDKKKFGYFTKELNIELIKKINERDKLCIYCGKILSENRSEFEYDHLQPFKPISKFNIVRCCKQCNRSKLNANVFEWCEFMKYTPNKLVYELYKKIK